MRTHKERMLSLPNASIDEVTGATTKTKQIWRIKRDGGCLVSCMPLKKKVEEK